MSCLLAGFCSRGASPLCPEGASVLPAQGIALGPRGKPTNLSSSAQRANHSVDVLGRWPDRTILYPPSPQGDALGWKMAGPSARTGNKTCPLWDAHFVISELFRVSVPSYWPSHSIQMGSGSLRTGRKIFPDGRKYRQPDAALLVPAMPILAVCRPVAVLQRIMSRKITTLPNCMLGFSCWEFRRGSDAPPDRDPAERRQSGRPLPAGCEAGEEAMRRSRMRTWRGVVALLLGAAMTSGCAR